MNLDNNSITAKQQNYPCAKTQAAPVNPVGNSKGALQPAKLNTEGLNAGKNYSPSYIIYRGMPLPVKPIESPKPANTGVNRGLGLKIMYSCKDGKNFEIDYNTKYVLFAQKLIKEKYGRDLTKYDLININVPPIKLLPEGIETALASLKAQNPEKYQTVKQILNSTFIYIKTKQGVSEDYIQKFIEKLSQCDDVLLKNLADNNIPIRIYDDAALYPGAASHATYVQSKTLISDLDGVKNFALDDKIRCLVFSQNAGGDTVKVNGQAKDTFESLPHELAHAFDHNNGQKLNLTKQDLVSIIDGEDYSRLAKLPSFSKEFDDSITKDILNMFEIDKQSGIPEGQTFKNLLENKHFGYYFGVLQDAETQGFSDVVARKELFAQFVSFVTSGKVTDEVFQSKIKELFPNCIDFAKKIMKMAKCL